MNNNTTTLNELISNILKKKRSYIRLIIASIFLGIAINFILPKKYIAEMSITQSSSGVSGALGGVSNLASSFGINLGNMKGDIFYLPNIVNSKSLKKNILLKKRLINNEESTLLDYFNSKGMFDFSEKSEQEKLIDAIDIFSENTIIIEDQNSGMITVKFISSSPELSFDIVTDIQSNINIFLNSGINLHASSMLELINEEVDLTKKDLTLAENKLAQFVENNRSYLDSPNLVLEYTRLERDIQIFNEKYLNLIIQQTMTMIEEKKQLPKLNIISAPISDPNPYSPNLLYIILFILFFNLVLMTSYIVYNTQRYK